MKLSDQTTVQRFPPQRTVPELSPITTGYFRTERARGEPHIRLILLANFWANKATPWSTERMFADLASSSIALRARRGDQDARCCPKSGKATPRARPRTGRTHKAEDRRDQCQHRDGQVSGRECRDVTTGGDTAKSRIACRLARPASGLNISVTRLKRAATTTVTKRSTET